MLKTDMIDKLNEQMNLELYSSLLYQQMSAWCSYHSFEGAAAFLRRHAQEEMTHMQRLVRLSNRHRQPAADQRYRLPVCRICLTRRAVPPDLRA